MNVMIARKKKKLTQEQLADIVGVSRITISRIENGKDAGISKDIMLRIAKALDSTVEYLFFSTEV